MGVSQSHAMKAYLKWSVITADARREIKTLTIPMCNVTSLVIGQNKIPNQSGSRLRLFKNKVSRVSDDTVSF